MRNEEDNLLPCPTPEHVDRALEAFWRGSTKEFDNLLGDMESSDPTVVKMLRRLFEHCGDLRPGDGPVAGADRPTPS